ncbi:pyrroline-5-carboxylate reductase [Chlorobium phaeobacteroides]|jgi:pyrroline-5-carboxylate reductase|uniref:Pyrroline-5-carboxylate reductase n=1 Tax=Chlorobium phaeobacteroides (strain DSM 266 / SMG 266 / 2430) TaxID=290317 RepID=A1BJ77_CHLPD|nr:pyrroline-5-carboxylate reductase [Chlorobium phaeobacteroides]ABL66454.1 pyrroline-5-carboxylate reductase [Chlorobium phaeobacteroides DSM 266]MBV5319518.1 pyrroline-5-carboxylate reductase [Chlorobium phaeobacteroides]
MNQLSISFIGTGRIARAIIAGLSNRKNTIISGFDKEPAALASIAGTYPVQPCASIEEAARESRVIILAVKPYQIAEVLQILKPIVTQDHLLISVAAGISSGFIRQNTSETMRVIRVMPNTPAFSGQGMTAISRGAHATDEDLATAVELFQAIGKTAILDESKMDAATAVSGSGPAYMFQVLDSLAEGGVRCGLTSEEALFLAAQTMLGAATMVLGGEKSPKTLISEVTTPGGTTEAGLNVMREKNIHQTLIDTVAAAAARSRELMQ